VRMRVRVCSYAAMHCDLLHLLSDHLPIFDELCRRSLMFIYSINVSFTVQDW